MEENESLLGKILKNFSKQEGLDALLSMSEHWNGYKREDAVRQLDLLGNPIAIPKLIIRANDWVPQVRNAARESLQKLLKSDNAQAFVYSLPDLYHLRNCGRDNHKQLIDNVIHFLLQPDNVNYIKLAIKNDDPYITRIAVRLCIEYSLIDKQELVTQCLSHRDVIVRNIVSNLLCEFSGDTLEFFLQKSIQDPFMPIRREAFQIYLRSFPEKGLKLARDFLFDAHISIREIAIKQLMEKNIDVDKILFNVLSSDTQSAKKVRCSILGLAELGSKHATPIVKKLSSHSLPSIRKASLQALTKLMGEDAKLYLLSGLKDMSPGVAKESSRLLNKLKLSLSADELIDIVERYHYQHTLSVCLSNAKMINKCAVSLYHLGLAPTYFIRNKQPNSTLMTGVT